MRLPKSRRVSFANPHPRPYHSRECQAEKKERERMGKKERAVEEKWEAVFYGARRPSAEMRHWSTISFVPRLYDVT